MDLLLLIVLLILTFCTGSIIEKNHFKKLIKREKVLLRSPIVSFGVKKWSSKRKVKRTNMVYGEAVIGADYFKCFVSNIKNFFGGRMTSFESVMDRARREAVLRMRESAIGAHIILNARIETVMVNDPKNPQSVPQCAVIAYGTAVTYEQ
ncbi:MAG: heavy metal-binding domain-containing protein [Brachyspira sp.]|jgi:hypothetical protein|nr:heavy metal-binding domain-containing protein [Brachyspira sp.]